MSNDGRGAARALTLVKPAQAEDLAHVWFCSHCGARPYLAPAAEPHSRVCEECSLGLLLEARTDAAPEPGSPFVILDSSMSVCAVSRAAERLLETQETNAVNHHVTELVVPADTEAQGPANLAVAVTWAARGDDAPRSVMVRPAKTFGIRMNAKITSCGPPRAALLVFD